MFVKNFILTEDKPEGIFKIIFPILFEWTSYIRARITKQLKIMISRELFNLKILLAYYILIKAKHSPYGYRLKDFSWQRPYDE